jgi:serine/threonine protein kinase
MENVVIADNLNAKLIDFGTAKPIKMENFYTNAQIQFLGKLRMCEANE